MKQLNIREIAKRYDVSEPTVFRWLREGRLPSPTPQPGGRLRWSLTDLEAWEAGGFQRTIEMKKKVNVAALEKKLAAIERQIVETQRELQRLAAQAQRADGQPVPVGDHYAK